MKHISSFFVIALFLIPQQPWLKTCPVSSEDIFTSVKDSSGAT